MLNGSLVIPYVYKSKLPWHVISTIVFVIGGDSLKSHLNISIDAWKSTSLKNYPQPMLVKSLGIQFVINTRHVESSSVITSVLEIMSLRDKY